MAQTEKQSLLTSITAGWRLARTVNKLTAQFSPGPELSEELARNGVTKEGWSKLKIGSDISPKGIIYSLGGFSFFMTHGEIYKTANKKNWL